MIGRKTETNCLHNIMIASLRFYTTTASAGLKRTPLYQFHLDHGATRMIPYAGWSMPLQYQDATVAESVRHCRTKASLFDVSHMLQTAIMLNRDDHHRGSNVDDDPFQLAAEFVEQLMPVDLLSPEPMQMQLGLFLDAKGGIMDDAIVGKIVSPSLSSVDNPHLRPHVRIVSNAGTTAKITKHLSQSIKGFSLGIVSMSADGGGNGLLAIQGPASVEALGRRLLPNGQHEQLSFMQSAWIRPDPRVLKGSPPLLLTRCGYTGEDGYEISVPASLAAKVASLLLDDGSLVRLAGLAARDCLRLEAGLCLSGQDFDETTGPREAGLSWTMAGRRRRDKEHPNTNNNLGNGSFGIIKPLPLSHYRRVGVVLADEDQHQPPNTVVSHSRLPPLRPGLPVYLGDDDGTNSNPILTQSGSIKPLQITSGTWSPILERSIGMVYLPRSHNTGDGTLSVGIRGRQYPLRITKMPFVPTRYHRKP